MKSICFYLILMLTVNIGFAQTWSDPITVSDGGYNNRPDFTVDKSGTIHCVWSHKITTNFRKIFYAQSTDNGQTWSSPTDISRNTTLWMDGPHIVADSNNNLHVVYDYNIGDYSKTRICYIKFDGNTWSQPIFLADDMPGADYNLLAVDHNNKVYCFWFYGNFVYRVLENGNWGSINQPYIWNHDMYFINKVIVDMQNDLHCIGIHHYKGQTSYDDKVIYFSMVSGQWSNFIEVSDTLSWENCDLGLKRDGFPAFAWGQLRRDTSIDQTGTYFSEIINSGMTEPLLLGRDATDAAIAIDNNDQIHIVDNEKTITDSFQLSYHYYDSSKWTNKILQKNKLGFYQNILRSSKSFLFLMMKRLDVGNATSAIVFSKLMVKTGINEYNNNDLIRIYPNPSSGILTIQLTTSSIEDIRILLKDYLGRTIYSIFKGKTTPGDMKFFFYATNVNDVLTPGMYFICIQLGEKNINRKVLFLPDTN